MKACLSCGHMIETNGGRQMRCGSIKLKGTCAWIYAQERKVQYRAMMREKLKRETPAVAPKKRKLFERDLIVSDWCMY